MIEWNHHDNDIMYIPRIWYKLLRIKGKSPPWMTVMLSFIKKETVFFNCLLLLIVAPVRLISFQSYTFHPNTTTNTPLCFLSCRWPTIQAETNSNLTAKQLTGTNSKTWLFFSFEAPLYPIMSFCDVSLLSIMKIKHHLIKLAPDSLKPYMYANTNTVHVFPDGFFFLYMK